MRIAAAYLAYAGAAFAAAVKVFSIVAHACNFDRARGCDRPLGHRPVAILLFPHRVCSALSQRGAFVARHVVLFDFTSFSTLADVKSAIDKWADHARTRLKELRAASK